MYFFLSFANITYTMYNKNIYKKQYYDITEKKYCHFLLFYFILHFRNQCLIFLKRKGIDLELYLLYLHGFYTFHKSLLPFNICLYIYCLTTFIVHNITLFSLPSSSSSSILYPKNSSNFCDTTYASCYASESQFLSWVSWTTITKRNSETFLIFTSNFTK